MEATFFVTGERTAALPGIVSRTSEEGHRIGNHSWSHPELTTLDRAQVKAQLRRTNEVIEQVTGETPSEWRPPSGATNGLVEAAAPDRGPGTPSWRARRRGPGEGARGRMADFLRLTVRDRVGSIEYDRRPVNGLGGSRLS